MIASLNREKITRGTGSEVLEGVRGRSILIVFALILGLASLKMGALLAFAVLGLPFIVWFTGSLIINPRIALLMSLVMAFATSGIGRYVSAPWGLTIDFFLFIGWLGMFFKHFRKTDWSPLRNSVMTMALVWFGLVALELVNPESQSAVAWFYAMRSAGFYQVLLFGLVLMFFRHPKYLTRYIDLVFIFSLFGAIWGLKQMILGTDAAEDYWLYVEGHEDQHILHGVLRVFSYYSDAGQFGSSQAMIFTMCGVLYMGPFSKKRKIWFLVVGIMTFIGFGISGTRGALAVPAGGILTYLVVSKNFRLLIVGLLIMGSTFYALKYTMVMQGVGQVARMRTALDPQDASLQVRFQNQVIFGNYLRSRPFGGGIGSAGYWGQRFSPNTLLAQTPTDSYYVKVWAETGIIGICLHLFMLGFFVGKCGYVIWYIRNEALRYQCMAILAALVGMMCSSFGNQVLLQPPTSIFLFIGIPMICLAPLYDDILDKERKSPV